MFTGIIKEVGEITNIEAKENLSTFVVKCQEILENKKIGDSIAINGACVTITELTENSFKFDAIKETLDKTNLSSFKIGSKVNLEPALTLNQGLDGHLVQGHVDTMGEIEEINSGEGKTTITINYPPIIGKYLAYKGSITINGVSLTISDLQAETFSVELIPHTLEKTNLGELKQTDKVNLEIDLIARYLEKLLNNKDKQITYDFLKDRGFL